MLEHCAAAGVKATVEQRRRRAIGAPPRRSPASSQAAAGSIANAVFELRDGRIVRRARRDLAGDPRPTERRQTMPKASKETASEHETVEGYEGHFEHFEGGWTVGFEAYTAGRRPRAAVQGASRRRVPVRAHGLRDPREGRRSARPAARSCSRRGDAYYVGPGPHPDPLRRHRGRRVQPDRRARPDHGGRDQEHAADGRRVLLSGGPGARLDGRPRLGGHGPRRACPRSLPRPRRHSDGDAQPLARSQSARSTVAVRSGSIRCGGSKWWRSAKTSSVLSGKIATARSAIRPW